MICQKNEAIAACIYIAYISTGRNPHVGFRWTTTASVSVCTLADHRSINTMVISTWDAEQEGLTKKTLQIWITPGSNWSTLLLFILLVLSWFILLHVYIFCIYLKSYKTITTNGFIFIYTQGALHIQSICNWVQLEVHTRGFGRIDHKKSPYQIWEGKAFHHGHKSNTRACGRANPFPKTLENEPGTSDHVQVWKHIALIFSWFVENENMHLHAGNM